MFYIYILYSPSADKFYVGHNENNQQRLEEHYNSERITFTSRHRPWELKAVFECGNDWGQALKIELFIKKQKSRKLIEKMVQGQALYGKLAQLFRVPYVRH